MTARLDLEARLRALREPRTHVQPQAVPPMMPTPHVVVAPSPEPVVTVPAAAPPPVAVPPKRTSFSRPRPNFAALSTPVAPPPPAAVSRPGSLLEKRPSDRSMMPPPPPIDMANVLGPAYEAAVAQAQFAIECERKRLVHTAIDAYIGSGQALVVLGRQQTVPHLQNILRTKALALLQRAEGLEEWAARVIAEIHAKDAAAAAASGVAVAARSKEETLSVAIAQSQEQEEQSLKEKEALVAQMKNQNNEMIKKLNQLVLLTKVRARFRRVISDRRARKAEEQRLRGESGDDHGDEELDVDLARSGSVVEDQDDEVDAARRETSTPAKTATSLPTSLSSSPREEQKRTLLNELHQRIGLPQVDHLRTFQPLAETADSDRRRDDLARELEDARLEAEQLRVAVQEMEDTLRAAAEHSRERSIKLEKEKEDEVAQLQAELARMKSALEIERKSSSKRSSVYLDSDDDEDDDDEDDDEDESIRERDPGAYEDNDIIDKLRVSLRGLSQDDTASPRERRSSSGRANRVARTSETHSSPRHHTHRMGSWGFDRDDEKHDEGESEDGLWV